jgi:Uncharacterized copper-binding protein
MATIHTAVTPRRRALLSVLAGSVLVLAAACGSPSTTAPTTTGPGTGAGTAGTTVTVTATDFKLALNTTSLAPGPYTFHIVNSGKAPHALELEGPGTEEQKTAVVQPGQSADLPATLQAGDYNLYCPVDGHRGKGMELKLTIGGTGGASAPASSSSGGY